MALSNDLISQLVKVNKEPKKPSESTVYGTAKVDDGKTYVQLDGSDIYTPVNTTSSVKTGDRVTVMIKNHSATITGNMSDPAASGDVVDSHDKKISEFDEIVAHKLKVDELEAIHAIIGTLEAEIANIGELSALKATIDELKAKFIDVERLTASDIEAINALIEHLEAGSIEVGFLDAIKAEIDQLKVYTGEFTYLSAEVLEAIKASIKDLDVENLEATFAKIKDLEAVRANIGTLTADVAEIDSLIFGGASGMTVHSGFVNAIVAMIGEAQIKEAMIEDLSVSKIKSGTISTNNFQVQSDDGRLVISDNTIQIKDTGDVVRVQIGQDKSGDYSITICNADGDVMFSKGGLTGHAIPEAIIRDDMILDDANISGKKIDIGSLVTEINDSKETIKSSKILLDADNQTLDISFKQMQTDVSGLSDSVSSQGTDISVIQGQINSKIWKQDFDAFVQDPSGYVMGDIAELRTQYSELDQQLDSITATVVNNKTIIDNMDESVTEVENMVSQMALDLEGFRTNISKTYATKSDIDDITVGGRNLIPKSKDLIFEDHYYFKDVTLSVTSNVIGNVVIDSDEIISVTDDGWGNVTIETSGFIDHKYDGEGTVMFG